MRLVSGILTALALVSTEVYGQENAQSGPLVNVSVGSGILRLPRVEDGRSGSTWDSDVSQQYRVSVDRYIGGSTSLGVAVAFADLGMTFSRFRPTSSTLTACPSSCQASAQVVMVGAALRVASEERLHQLFETLVGVTMFSGFVEDATGSSIVGPDGGSTDMTVTMGYGVGWRASSRIHAALVGDVGITVHTRSGLHADNSRVDQILGARLSVRAGVF